MEDMIPFNGLRGVCAMAIFLGHQTDLFLAPLPTWMMKQQLDDVIAADDDDRKHEEEETRTVAVIGLEYLQAVSIFFLLSGIPLSRLYSSTNKVRTWNGTYQFWRKRCARLAPIYYLTLCLNLLVILLFSERIDTVPIVESFFGCAFFLQSWFVSLIDVGGVLWQVSVFLFGYLLFPFYSHRIKEWRDISLQWGIICLWLFSAGLWVAFPYICSPAAMGWWIWHVHCISRLPHVFAGVMLGELVERKRGCSAADSSFWALVTDLLSFVLVVTAIQAPIVQWYYGTEIRSDVSIGLQAWLLPVHALWLAGMVLTYQPSVDGDIECRDRVCCWTRRALSIKPLAALGDVSLVLYCIHLVVLFLYAGAYAYVSTGDWRITPSIKDLTPRVRVPWWHAPIQWAIVVVLSFVVSRYFEAPSRRIIAGSGRQFAETQQTKDSEATALLPSNSRRVA